MTFRTPHQSSELKSDFPKSVSRWGVSFGSGLTEILPKMVSEKEVTLREHKL